MHRKPHGAAPSKHTVLGPKHVTLDTLMCLMQVNMGSSKGIGYKVF
jgi:hypothetical protein